MVPRVKDNNPFGTQKTVSLDFDEEKACALNSIQSINQSIVNAKMTVPCHRWCGALKTPHCSMAISVEYKTEFAAR